MMLDQDILLVRGLLQHLTERYGDLGWEIDITPSHRDLGFFATVSCAAGSPTKARRHVPLTLAASNIDHVAERIQGVVMELAESMLPAGVLAERRYLDCLEHFIATSP